MRDEVLQDPWPMAARVRVLHEYEYILTTTLASITISITIAKNHHFTDHTSHHTHHTHHTSHHTTQATNEDRHTNLFLPNLEQTGVL